MSAKRRHGKTTARHTPTDAELTNDPSLKWTRYAKWELLYSDAFDDLVRFVDYTSEGLVRVATVNSMCEFEGIALDPLSVRRPVGGVDRISDEQKQAIIALQKSIRHANKKS